MKGGVVGVLCVCTLYMQKKNYFHPTEFSASVHENSFMLHTQYLYLYVNYFVRGYLRNGSYNWL